MKLSEMKIASVKAVYRREMRDLKKRTEANEPPGIIIVCGYALLATMDELNRRGCELPKLRKAVGGK